MGYSMNSEQRLLYVIDRLMQGEVGNDTLAWEIYEENNDRTRTNIRNTLKAIRKYFGDKLVETRRGHHKLIGYSQELHDLYRVPAKDLTDIFEFIALFDEVKLKLLAESEPELIAKIKRDSKKIYHVFDAPIEQIENTEYWEQIKKAIRQRRYLSIAYEKNKLKTYNFIKPIRIVFSRNNWYLAALLTEEKEDYDFTFFRLNHIKFIKTEIKNFHNDTELLEHLKSMQSLFHSYGATPYKTLLKVDKSIAQYFKQKKYLKSQTIVEEQKDGSLILSYMITHPMEIMTVIKQWIPDIEVLEPEFIKIDLEQQVWDYIQ